MIFLPKKSLLATEQDFSALGGTVTTNGGGSGGSGIVIVRYTR